MYRDMGVASEAGFEFLFYLCGPFVGFVERGVAVHPHVDFDGSAVTYPSCPQVVGFADIGQGTDDVFYFAFGLFGE